MNSPSVVHAELLQKGQIYTYDHAGNITSKKTYGFLIENDGAPLSTVTYTYGDSSWRDLLTSYNGTAITYDEIGNPLTVGYEEEYGTGTFLMWNGRELAPLVLVRKTKYHMRNSNSNGVAVFLWIFSYIPNFTIKNSISSCILKAEVL